jgi:hypothetical protein
MNNVRILLPYTMFILGTLTVLVGISEMYSKRIRFGILCSLVSGHYLSALILIITKELFSSFSFCYEGTGKLKKHNKHFPTRQGIN